VLPERQELKFKILFRYDFMPRRVEGSNSTHWDFRMLKRKSNPCTGFGSTTGKVLSFLTTFFGFPGHSPGSINDNKGK
jgi:hypothetical protein